MSEDQKTFYNSYNVKYIGGSATATYVSYARNVLVRPPKVDYLRFYLANGYMPIREYEASGLRQKYVPSTLEVVETKRYTTYPYSVYGSKVETFVGNFSITVPDEPVLGLDTLHGNWYDSLWDELHADANARALDRIRSTQAGIAETIVEARRSRDMMVDAAHRVLNALNAVRRRRFREAAEHLGMGEVPPGIKRRRPPKVSKSKYLSDNWLAYRYGWTPLYITVAEAMKVTHDHVSRGVIRVVKGKSARTYTGWRDAPTALDAPFDNVVQGIPPRTYVNTTVRITGLKSYKVQSQYVVRFDNNNVVTADRLGLLNVAGLAWELVPYSFVVDWFINIGDLLSDMTALAGSTVLSRGKTYFYEKSIERSSYYRTFHSQFYPSKKTSNYISASMTVGKHSRADWKMKRWVYTTAEPRTVQFSNGLNMVRLVDALGLARGLLTNKQWAALTLRGWVPRTPSAPNRSKRSNKWLGYEHL